MIRRSTVVYIVILLGLVAAYFYFRDRAPEEPAEDVLTTPEATEQINYLFSAEDGVPTAIRVQASSGETVEVARDADNAWVLTQPVEARAEQGSSEAAASQITTMRIVDTVSDVDPGVVGLEDPAYVLTVKFSDDVQRTVNIGVITPSESGYYVQEASGEEVFIVSRSAVDALLGLLTTPPYLETPTPSPPATDTALPTAPVTSTPNETVAPNP